MSASTIATIKDKCEAWFLPCLYHKIDIGYYDVSLKDSLEAIFSGDYDMVLLVDGLKAYFRIVVFFGVIFYIGLEVMTTLSGQLFDAAENADMTQVFMSAIKGSAYAGKLAGKTAFYGSKNAAKSLIKG